MDENRPLLWRWSSRWGRIEMTRNPQNDGSDHWLKVDESRYTPEELTAMERKYAPPIRHRHIPVLDPGDY